MDDAITLETQTALTHLDKGNGYVRMLFVNYSLSFSTSIPHKLACRSTTDDLHSQLDFQLPDQQVPSTQHL